MRQEMPSHDLLFLVLLRHTSSCFGFFRRSIRRKALFTGSAAPRIWAGCWILTSGRQGLFL